MMNEYDLDKLEIEKMRKATNDLKQMQANFAKYGVYVLDRDIPEPTDRKSLYDRLGTDTIFNEINDKYNETQKEIQRINKDGRYKDEFKGVHKQKTLEAFNQFKEAKLNEIKDKMNVYRNDIEAKHKPVIEDKQAEATAINNSLLQLAFIQQLDNNEEILKGYINENWNRPQVISLVENMFKDNANVVSQIVTKRKEDQAPYELVDSCIRDIDVFISNKDYNVNSDYIQNGITKFNPIDGGANEE